MSETSASVIFASQVLPIENPMQYKLHLARWNGRSQPLDVFTRDREEWLGWNRWRSTKNDFPREFIFSLIDFYPQRERWLFGGAFRILERNSAPNAHSYRIEPVPAFEPFVGRLKLILPSPGRSRAFNLENQLGQMVVDELLAVAYTGEPFCGFDRINHTFAQLETIFKTQRQDWKGAMQNAKGIYLITDRNANKRYVGSAYGAYGLWSRWECYLGTGHGYNDELCKLIGEKGIAYARENFSFSLLEYFAPSVDDLHILQREAHWKTALLTRRPDGYNAN